MSIPSNAYFVRNHSGSRQLTVFASDNKEARRIGHELIGERNKSRLMAAPASSVKGYGQ